MRITLNQAEIEEAIELLITDQVTVPEDMRIDIDLKATRGEEGYQAYIDIVKNDAPKNGTDRSIDDRVKPIEGSETLGIAKKVLDARNQAEAPRRRGRPAGSKNKPKTDSTTEVSAPAATTPAPVAETAPVSEPVTTEATPEKAPEVVTAVQEPVAGPVEEEKAVEVEATPEPAQAVEATTSVPHPAAMDHVDHAQTEVVPEPEEKVDYQAAVKASETSTTVADTVVEPTEATEAEQVEQAANPAPAAPTKSLFANLSKPVNG